MDRETAIEGFKAARERIRLRRADPNYVRRPIDDTMDEIFRRMKKTTEYFCEGKEAPLGEGLLSIEDLTKSFTWEERFESDVLIQEAIESYHAEKASQGVSHCHFI